LTGRNKYRKGQNKSVRICLILLGIFGGFQMTLGQQNTLEIDASKGLAAIAPTMYGIFFEDINFAADGGLYGELIKNGSFEFPLPKMGWQEPNSDRYGFNPDSGTAAVIQYANPSANLRYLQVQINNSEGYQLINEGYRGIGVKANATYVFSLKAANPQGVNRVHAALVDQNNRVIGSTSVDINGNSWTNLESEMVATATVEKAKLLLRFEGKGTLDLDMISLFPKDTWKGRKKGLRKDLVTLLEGLNPGFLRFPGGCIVEGRTLAQRYQWKKTVGTLEQRKNLINRWNTEFNHRLTPDYYQSFGLGFYEYFLLAEDLGAAPLPILGCGMACQFNTAELVPMDELDPYIQDALDLIEFANGSQDTYWGKLRHDMGHPKPFNMRYIGIGNEQWGPEYIKRYIAFEKAIKEKYPDIIIVSGSGPFPEGDFFEYGWEALKKTQTEIVDEHYYRSPEWFRENADRYDTYDRKGPKVFAGEYAAQSVAIASPKNENNWECALAEAAFLTGIERNADLVTMTSYAPLMAHTDAWQWKTDLIWFNNLMAYGTPSYYVQKMFGQNPGTKTLKTQLNGEKAIGQNELYASAVVDENKNEVIVKLVNTATTSQRISLQIEGANWLRKGAIERLAFDDLEAINSLGSPNKISTQTEEITWSKKTPVYEAPPQSFSVLKFHKK